MCEARVEAEQHEKKLDIYYYLCYVAILKERRGPESQPQQGLTLSSRF